MKRIISLKNKKIGFASNLIILSAIQYDNNSFNLHAMNMIFQNWICWNDRLRWFYLPSQKYDNQKNNINLNVLFIFKINYCKANIIESASDNFSFAISLI